jgi:predicted transposase YdaD
MYLAKQEKESFIDGIIEGEKLGLERGEKLGLEKGKLEIARSLKAKGFHDVMISEVIGLTFEEIKNII